jgi:hypothetical protein
MDKGQSGRNMICHFLRLTGLSGPPDLLSVNLGGLLGELFTVVLLSVERERSSGLVSVLDVLVERLEDGQVGLVELGGPVEGSSSGGGGTGVVHVVHTVLADQGEEAMNKDWQGVSKRSSSPIRTETYDWVASSTVSLKASDGECPFSLRTWY